MPFTIERDNSFYHSHRVLVAPDPEREGCFLSTFKGDTKGAIKFDTEEQAQRCIDGIDPPRPAGLLSDGPRWADLNPTIVRIEE